MQSQVTITRVVARGWKVGNFDVALSGRTLLVGRNGSGKTAVLDAARAAILGYVPALGKRLQDTAALMLGRSAEVALYLSDGRVLSWSIDRSARGSLSSRVSCSWLPDGATQAEHAAAALELIADDETTVAEILDARTLIRATPKERAARIQGFIAASAMDGEERKDVAFDAAVRRLADAVGRAVPTEACVPMIPGTAPHGVHFGQRHVFDGAIMPFLAWAEESSATAIEQSRNRKNEAARGLRDKKAARDELASRLEALPAVDEERLAADRARLVEIAKLESVDEYRVAQAKRQDAARKRAVAELDEAKEAVEKWRTEAHRTAEGAKDIASLEAELAAARAWLDGAAEPVYVEPEAIAKLRAEHERLGHKLAELTYSIETIDRAGGAPDNREVERLEAEVARIDKELAGAAHDPWRKVLSFCTFAGAMDLDALLVDGIAELRELANEHVRIDLVEAQRIRIETGERLEAARLKLAQDREAHQDRQRRRDVLAEDHRTVLDVRAEVAAKLEGIESAARRQHAAAVADHRREREQALRNIGAIEARIGALRSEAFLAAQAKANAENRLASATQVLNDLGEPEDLDVEDYSEEREQIAERVKRDEAVIAERAGLERLTDELQNVAAERDVFAAFEWAAQQVQAEEVRRSGAALREPIGAKLGREVYIEIGKTACEIGWLDDARNRVSVEALSGGQFAFFLAALQAAISELRGGALRCIIVEAGECDDATMQAIAAGLQGFEGQVIAARWAPMLAESWSVVEL